MTARAKELVVGLTVNLDNYESLRFDYRAELETAQDAFDVAQLAGASLLGLANQAKDPRVAEKLRLKVAAVFGVTPDQLKPQPARQTMQEYQDEKAAKEQQAKAPVCQPDVTQPPTPPVTQPAGPSPAPKGAVAGACAACAAGITKKEQQISQLFRGKDLCTKCLNANPDAKGAKA